MDKLEEYALKAVKIGREVNDTAAIIGGLNALSLVYGDRKAFPKMIETANEALRLSELTDDATSFMHTPAPCSVLQSIGERPSGLSP